MRKNLVKKGLVLGIIILFVGVSVVSGLTIQLKNSTKSLINCDGNTLYVGGIGPNNYSKIQDAIDNTSNGDTVFVYDYSSPYYENVVIENNIDLIGEYKKYPVIESNAESTIKIITADNVKISGFTVLGGNTERFSGQIYIHSSTGSNIIDNIILANNSRHGISLIYSSFITISYNQILGQGGYGIALWSEECDNYNISHNIISDNSHGIHFDEDCEGNDIIGNKISNCHIAIYLGYESDNNDIFWNYIESSNFSLYIWNNSQYNKIYQNTFKNCQFRLDSSHNNEFYFNNFTDFDENDEVHRFSRTKFYNNFWNKPRRVMIIKGITHGIFKETTSWRYYDWFCSDKEIIIPDSELFDIPDFTYEFNIWVDDNWEGLPDGTVVYIDNEPHIIGIDAFAEIQDAIDISDTGDCICVKYGEYEFYSQNGIKIIDKNDLVLYGEDKPTITGSAVSLIDIENSPNVVINGFKIDGSSSRGIYIETSNGCSIIGNTITGEHASVGIEISEFSSYITISYNDILNQEDNGIVLKHQCHNNKISHNNIKNQLNGNAISLDNYCRNNKIFCNDISDVSTGVSLTGYSRFNDIYWNLFKNIDKGFYLNDAYDNNITQNKFDKAFNKAIYPLEASLYLIENSERNDFYCNHFTDFNEKSWIHKESSSNWYCNYWMEVRYIMTIRGIKEKYNIEDFPNPERDTRCGRETIRIPVHGNPLS